MPILSIFNGTYCHEDEILEGLQKSLNYRIANQELLEKTAETFSINIGKLEKFVHGSPEDIKKISSDNDRILAYLRVTLSELMSENDLIFAGPITHLIPLRIPHVLKICLIANSDYRVRNAILAKNQSVEEAVDLIHSDDSSLRKWVRYFRHTRPYDESLYDIVYAMQSISVDETLKEIQKAINNPALAFSTTSEKITADFKLAAKVHLALVEKGFEVEVDSENGLITVALNKYTSRLKHQQKKIAKIAEGIPGVKEVKSHPGNRFTPPSLLPLPDLDMPSKILLVDDEMEFVHTLSERLQARDLDSSVVYDGEQALEYIKNEEPDVMVLDLKMPGIDGLEVLERVKKDHPAIEVIILTGHGSPREEEIAMQLGAFAYLQKPVNINVLSKTMKEAYNKIGKPPKNIPEA